LRLLLLPILLAHGIEILSVDTTSRASHVHTHKRHRRTSCLIGRSRLHSSSLSTNHVGSSHGGIPEYSITLKFLDHLLVVFIGSHTVNTEGNNCDTAQVIPLTRQDGVKSFSHFFGATRQLRITDPLSRNPGEGRLKCSHQL
jgi:hypothetical protein